MLALSVRQYWAALVALALKDVENRSWATPYRGLVLIHAGVRPSDTLRDLALAKRLAAERCGMTLIQVEDLFARQRGVCRFGGIIGVARIVDCVQGYDSPWAEPGMWHWVFAEARPLAFHPCAGHLRLFEAGYPGLEAA